MSQRFRRSAISGVFLALLAAASAQTPPDSGAIPRHLQQARQLVETLRGVQENVYGGGKRHIVWGTGQGAARTVCSSFVTLLLQHTYGWSVGDVRAWLNSADPEADAYHDAIVDRRGFERVLRVSALRRGDFLAVKYTDHHVSSNGVEDTGHVMVVDEAPLALSDEKPVVRDTRQYAVTVIDSSASGHGPTDTRHTPGGGFTGGIGRGLIRLYADHDGRIVGYTWSDTHKSEYETSPARDMVAGRLIGDPPTVPGAHVN